jgi:hypothetical protein
LPFSFRPQQFVLTSFTHTENTIWLCDICATMPHAYNQIFINCILPNKMKAPFSTATSGTEKSTERDGGF